ncbi:MULTISPECIES: phosphotransferase [Brenneria]|uniref:Thiamine kinase n=1 Tax=Brenneria nigrifluens DSM 30175 = ATCC 13028 TaxID=1121120 RepID=A0A2U1US26_9GAMM|nr:MULTISPECIES: phosphotransferase [Brenneria]EHD21048.1 Thiamine kinase [Brenneria sp. EniD312]PWC24473.1 thiamine kinase [Brenneria nigrifluens] [Brenneria nigrifluens DSM 30175 = ATCC 13028]QCR04201.1 thiamine kinase [Brenneria nigrifluens] [Brenneria nigrifluens DSM 30175 = ATCC 13028]
MVKSNVEQRLTAVISKHFPAAESAGFHISPVGGLSSESWRISSEQFNGLARPQSASGRLSGSDRQREFRLLRQMAGVGLAPRPLLWRDGWLIIEWAAGRAATQAEFSAALSDGELAGYLAHIHQRPPSGYPLALKPLFVRHWQQMDRRRRSPALLRLHRHFQRRALPKPLAIAPLHLDVHADNLLLTDKRMMLIDWEYAADGDIALELAFIVRANQLDGETQLRFLQRYHQRRPGFSVARLQRHTAQWLPWVDYLVLMWFEIRWRQTRQERFLQALAPLRQRLGIGE